MFQMLVSNSANEAEGTTDIYVLTEHLIYFNLLTCKLKCCMHFCYFNCDDYDLYKKSLKKLETAHLKILEYFIVAVSYKHQKLKQKGFEMFDFMCNEYRIY